MANTDWMRPLECDNGTYGFDDLMLLYKRNLVELIMRAFHRCEDMDKKIKKYGQKFADGILVCGKRLCRYRYCLCGKCF